MNRAENRNIISLTWEKQIRNYSIFYSMGVTLFVILSTHRRILRYALCIGRTLALLKREKPLAVIGQNPSLVLILLLLGLRRFFGFKVVIDAHFCGVEAYNGSGVLQRVLDYCNRAADLVIVTNEGHARLIRNLGGRVYVCPDPLPDLSDYCNQAEVISRKVFFICSFDPDEPTREVLKAGGILLQEGFQCFFSGDYRKAGITPGDFPNLGLLGFVPEAEYYRHLFSSELVVDLTNFDNCLVCGAYEALAAGKPLVLSRKKALQEYFTLGTVFTFNYAEQIAEAIKNAFSTRATLSEECRKWVPLELAAMEKRLASLAGILDDL